MKQFVWLTLFTLFLTQPTLAENKRECGYLDAPEFCDMEQYFLCKGTRKASYDAVLRLKTIGSNPYLFEGNGNALGQLRFEYDIWADFDDGFHYYASERHKGTGRYYENGAEQTNGPYVSYHIYDSQRGIIPTQNRDTTAIKEGVKLVLNIEEFYRDHFDTHYFMMHAVPEKKKFTLFWVSLDTPREKGEKGVLDRKVEKSICRPTKLATPKS